MFRKTRFFRETDVTTDCDACGLYFDIIKGGVCEKCRRILCERHLHGSWSRRLLADVTGRNLCVECRRGG